jgi:hypothetical protein
LQQIGQLTHLELLITQHREVHSLIDHAKCHGVAYIGSQQQKRVVTVRLKERPQESDKYDDAKVEEADADGFDLVGEVHGDEVDHDGCEHSERGHQEVHQHAVDEALWVMGGLVL